MKVQFTIKDSDSLQQWLHLVRYTSHHHFNFNIKQMVYAVVVAWVQSILYRFTYRNYNSFTSRWEKIILFLKCCYILVAQEIHIIFNNERHPHQWLNYLDLWRYCFNSWHILIYYVILEHLLHVELTVSHTRSKSHCPVKQASPNPCPAIKTDLSVHDNHLMSGHLQRWYEVESKLIKAQVKKSVTC